jgi:hypothetical protein
MKNILLYLFTSILTLTACQNQAAPESVEKTAADINSEITAKLDSIMLIRDSLFTVRIGISKEEVEADVLLQLKVSEFDVNDEGLKSTINQYQIAQKSYADGNIDLEFFEARANEKLQMAEMYIETLKKIAHVYFNPEIPN